MKPEQAKQILADAPEGATHVEINFDETTLDHLKYQNDEWFHFDSSEEWEPVYEFDCIPMSYIHDLADLRQIVEQAERIEALEKATKAFVSSLEFEAIDDINGACTIDNFDNVALLELQELSGE